MDGPHHNASSVLVTIDSPGRRLALTAQGNGPATVLLETGLGAESAEWQPVQDAVAHFARVCRYDRANRGHSGPAPVPRTVQDAADDLHRLVQAARITTPVVLVGHSLGGIIVRLYATQHPDHVAGLVLVDPMHEDQFERWGPLLPAATPGESPALTSFRQFWTTGWRDPSSNAEGIDFVRSQVQAHAVTTLGEVPLLVLGAGAATRALSSDTASLEPFRVAREAGLAELARQSSRGQLRMIEGSGHFMQRDAPHAVADAIRDLVQMR